MTLKSNDGSNFVQEYLYIEELPLEMINPEFIQRPDNKTDEAPRGVCVIDILGNEED